MARLPKGLKPLKKECGQKRARSGYFLWCDDVRAASSGDPEIEGKSMSIASVVLAERWRNLSVEEKQPYIDKAAELKAAFDLTKPRVEEKKKPVLVSGWRSSRDTMSGAVVYTSIVTKKSQWARPCEADAVALPPPPPTASRLYSMAVGVGRTVPLGATPPTPWANLETELRAPYEAQATAARKAYNARLTELRRGGLTPPP
jgi:hypothetical protein